MQTTTGIDIQIARYKEAQQHLESALNVAERCNSIDYQLDTVRQSIYTSLALTEAVIKLWEKMKAQNESK